MVLVLASADGELCALHMAWLLGPPLARTLAEHAEPAGIGSALSTLAPVRPCSTTRASGPRGANPEAKCQSGEHVWRLTASPPSAKKNKKQKKTLKVFVRHPKNGGKNTTQTVEEPNDQAAEIIVNCPLSGFRIRNAWTTDNCSSLSHVELLGSL